MGLLDVQLRHHRYGTADTPVFIVFVWKRRTKYCHDGVTNELVEHAALGLDAIDHDREILGPELDRALRAEFFGQRGEAADVREEDRRLLVLTTKHFLAAADQLICKGRVHIPRHGAFHAFF